MKKFYSTELYAREYLEVCLRFDEDEISLAIPRGGTTLQSGRKIIPLHNPVVSYYGNENNNITIMFFCCFFSQLFCAFFYVLHFHFT